MAISFKVLEGVNPFHPTLTTNSKDVFGGSLERRAPVGAAQPIEEPDENPAPPNVVKIREEKFNGIPIS